MPSTARWHTEDRIIYVTNVGDLSVADFRSVDAEIIALMDSAQVATSQKIHVLVDCIELQRLPNITELDGGSILSYLRKPQCGTTVIVDPGRNIFLKLLSRFLVNMSRSNVQFCDTVDEGIMLLQQQDNHA